MIVSSYPFHESDNERIACLCRASGMEYHPAPNDRDERIAHIDRHIADAEVFLGGRLAAAQFDRARRLRWIHVPWAGVNALLDVEAIRASNVLITNASGIMADGVADQVMACILLFSRAMMPLLRAMERREWITQSVEATQRRMLLGATIGIIGLGAIGRATARRARVFGMRIIATRRSVGDGNDPDVDHLLPSSRLHDLLDRSDYVVIALPLTDDTRALFGRAEFRAMKSTAILVNIARGAIVREDELIEALRERRIGGAALDVFEREPLPAESPLWEMENVIVTPHSSGGFDLFRQRSADLFIRNLERYTEGKPLLNVVDRVRGY